MGEKRADRRAALETELTRIRTEIQQKQTQLEQLRPNVDALHDEVETLRAALEETKARVSALYSKQGRSAQFRNQRDRDEYLRSQMGGLDQFVRSQQARIDETARERANATERRSAALRKIKRSKPTSKAVKRQSSSLRPNTLPSETAVTSCPKRARTCGRRRSRFDLRLPSLVTSSRTLSANLSA